MASRSAYRTSVIDRIRNAASTLYSDNQAFTLEIRKSLNMMKNVAVDLEKENQSQMVNDLENAVVELLETCEDCTHLSSAIQSVGNAYQPQNDESTDFKKLLKDEVQKHKGTSVQNHPFLRQFREAIWNVHHAGQPMPGDEQEDIVMTSTQCNILNKTCPLSGKPVTELEDPVRSMTCKHIYEKNAIMAYINSKNARCPIAACPKMVAAGTVICDELLKFEIDELRSMSKQSGRTEVIEDFTEFDDED